MISTLLFFAFVVTSAYSTSFFCDFLGATDISAHDINWNSSNCDDSSFTCDLTGVGCAGNEVNQIALNGRHIKGTIPSSIGTLSELVLLNMHSNSLTGVIPSSMRSLNKLQVVQLYSNSLSGTLSAELSGMTSLRTLLLQDNEMSGSLPDSFAAMTRLEEVQLQGNSFSGQFPSEMCSFAGLFTFKVTQSSSHECSLPTAIQSSQMPPNLVSCKYTDDGSYILATLDRASDKGRQKSPLVCSSLFNFSGTGDSSCSWASSGKSLKIYPAADSSLPIGSTLTLLSGSLRAECPIGTSSAECLDWATAPQQTCQLERPDNALSPSVVISAPSLIGACDDFLLDLTASSGSAGREWTVFNVSVQSTSGIAGIEAFYADTYTLSPPLALPADKITVPSSYTFVVVLCNIFDECGSASHSVEAVDTDVPLVSIAGSPSRNIRLKDSLTLTSVAIVHSCNAPSTSSGLSYTWLVYQNGLATGVLSSSSSPTRFVLQPFQLQVGHSYTITLTVEDAISPFAVEASVQVHVLPSYINAVLSGASSLSLRHGDVLQLDASRSSDDDVDDLTGAAAGLEFQWSCVSYQEQSVIPCVLSLTPDPGAPDKAAVQFIDESNADVVSIVMVNVSDGVRRFDVSSVEVIGVPLAAPSVSLIAQKSKIIASEKVTLLATVTLASSATAEWLISDRTIDLQSAALTPTSQSLAPGSHTFNLVLRRSSLYSGTSFAFSLAVDGTVSSSVDVEVVSPPVVGTFAANPQEGDSLLTEFTLSVSRWLDKELPISYSFGYETKAKNVVSLRSRSESTYVTSLLANDGSSVVTCRVTAFNALNAFSSSSVAVVVKSRKVSAENIDDLVEAATGQGSALSSDVKRVVALGSTSLNSVNCSLAPDCQSLNREECLSTTHSCGSCVDGFIGEDGDGNSQCHSAASNALEPADCLSDSDCVPFTQYCADDGVCAFQEKSCPLDCSGQGECRKEDLSSGEIIGTCLINDVTCVPVCVCSPGFSGSGCAATEDELRQRQSTRAKMIAALRNASQFDDESTDNALDLVQLISELAMFRTELTSSSCSKLLDMIARVYGLADELSLAFEDLAALYAVTDVCVQVAESEQGDGAVTTQMGAVDDYLDIVRRNIVVGESVVEFIQRMSRASTKIEGSLDGVSVDIPLSESEIALGLISSRIVVNSSSTETVGSTVSITASESPSRLYGNGTAFYANPVRIALTKKEASPSQTAVVTIVLQNREEHAHGEVVVTEANYTTICAEDDFSWHNYTCPAGGTVSHKCSGGSGTMNSYCPPVTIVPTCRVIVDGADVANSNCVVVDFNTTSTTCECTVPLEQRRRSLSEEQSTYETSGGLEVVSMATYSFDEFKGTIVDVEDIKAADLKKAILVVCMFAIMWSVGLVALFDDIWFTMSPHVAKERVRHRHRSSAVSTQSVHGSTACDVNERKKYLMAYLDTIFPTVFTEQSSGIKAMWKELKKHHRYSQIFAASGPNARHEKAQSIVQMLTVQTMLMFLLAVFYDLEYPSDNGVCETYTTEDRCLQESSIFDASETLCTWREKTASDGSAYSKCIYVQPDITIQTIVLISILIACCTAPINLVVDYLFDSILSAPSADEHKLTLEANVGNTHMRRMGRRVSEAARRMSAAVGVAASSAANSMKLKKRSTLVLDETTRVMPDNVIHLHALASNALGVSLVEAFAKREASRSDFSDIARSQSILSSPGNAEDVECGVGKTSRHMQRVNGIVSTAMSFSDSFSSSNLGAIVPEESAPLTSSGSRGSSLDQLLSDIAEQYPMLTYEEKKAFCEVWGWDPTTRHFTGKHSSMKAVLTCAGEAGGDMGVNKELRAVQNKCSEKADKLVIATDIHVGLELMYLFICDLLGWGSPAQIIFETKTSEDFRHSMVVTPTAKMLAWIAVILMNVFFVFFSVLRGMTREFRWQRGYVIACCIQLVIEVVLYESSECLWIHYAIPRLVRSDVNRILKHLESVIETAFSTSVERSDALDACSYFFVSTNLAEKFPQLFESVIILSYHSRLPPVGSLEGTKWAHPKENLAPVEVRTMENEWTYRLSVFVRRFSILVFLGGILQYIGTVHIRVQKVVIHTAQPLLVSFVVILLRYMTKNIMITAIIAAVIALELVLYELGDYVRRRREKARALADEKALKMRQQQQGVEMAGIAQSAQGDTFSSHHVSRNQSAGGYEALSSGSDDTPSGAKVATVEPGVAHIAPSSDDDDDEDDDENDVEDSDKDVPGEGKGRARVNVDISSSSEEEPMQDRRGRGVYDNESSEESDWPSSGDDDDEETEALNIRPAGAVEAN